MLFSPQIPLPLEPRRSGRFSDFVIGDNQPALEAMRLAATEPGQNLFLHGPPSSGKSHLLNAACLEARDLGRTAFYLGLRVLPKGGIESLQGLEAMDLVCVDDIDTVAGDDAWEEALFHLFNRVRDQGGSLVVSSSCRLRDLALGLPDLGSRLAWGLRVGLDSLGDEDKAKVMKENARARGFELPDEVAHYLLRHGQRDLASMVANVERLKEAAFQNKRKVTVPLAREVIRAPR